jgi:type IVB pilus formation R64 PilN family outer membrane protein
MQSSKIGQSMRTPIPILTLLLLLAAVSGCVSPALTGQVQANARLASARALEEFDKTNPVQSKESRLREEEVDMPYIVGKSVPLARSVTLPRALQKGVKTVAMFPERKVSLATAAERLMLATDINVVIAPDVYLDPGTLTRKTGKDNGAALVAAPMPNGMAAAPMPTPLPSFGAAGQAPKGDSATSFEFPRMEAPLAQILDVIATRLGIHWKYDEKTGSIRLFRLVTKSWDTPFSSANVSYTTLLEGTTSSSTNSGAVTAKSTSVPISSKHLDLNELNAIRDSVDKLLTRAGTVDANPATGTITVTDTSETIDTANELIRLEVRKLSRFVQLRVQTVQVTTSNSDEASVDLSAAISRAIRSLPDLSLSTHSPSAPASPNAGSLGLSIFSGAASGSSVVVKALREVGEVHSSTELPMSTRNRHAIYYNVRNVFSYVSATTPATATTGGTGGTPGITTAQEQVGLKLMLYPNVTSKDTVMLTMALDQSILQSLNSFSSGSGPNVQTVQLPTINGEGSSQEVPIRNGQTMVLTGFDRVGNEYDKRTLGEHVPVVAGGAVKANKSRTTTLVLVSVRIFDIE